MFYAEATRKLDKNGSDHVPPSQHLPSVVGIPVCFSNLVALYFGNLVKRKLYSDRTSHHYSCCNGNAGSDPCKYADTHVHEENRLDLTGYSSTASLQKVTQISPNRREPAVFGLDCEMIYTTVGFELARVTLVDDQYKTVMDKFVRPEGKVLDLNEKYSGIQHRHIDPKQNKKCVKDLKEARSMVRAIVSEDCYLLGHSLESDLCTLKLMHQKCIDTSVVFPHKRGLPYKRALKTLMHEYCGLVIQQEDEGDTFGHDSAVSSPHLTF